MPQVAIDLKKYERVSNDIFMNKMTGKYYKPMFRNGRIELVRAIFEQPATRPAQLQLPAPRYVSPREEEERTVYHPKERPFSEERKVFGPAVIAIICGLIFFAFAVPITVVHHIQQQQAQGPAKNPSESLVRISQTDPAQYDSPNEHDTWANSTCNAAVITMIMNAYGGNFHISNVLQIELNLGVISVDQGLLTNSGIDETANTMGFDVDTMDNPSLDLVINRANGGSPIMVDLPPQAGWPAGHFMVLVGGDDQNVQLADPWTTNWTTVSRGKFSQYWHGFAKVITPSKYNFLQGHSTVSVDEINSVLSANHSPVAGQGQMIIDLGNQYGVDPAYVVATFWHESTFGTRGEAVHSLSAGNLRCADWITWGWCQDGYEWFHSWKDGFKTLYMLLSGSQYESMGLTTPEAIIPKFAPQADNNNEAAYISAVKHSEDVLRAGGMYL